MLTALSKGTAALQEASVDTHVKVHRMFLTSLRESSGLS